MLWPWPLTSWPWTFVVLRGVMCTTLYKIWVKSSNPRQSYWRYRTFTLFNFRGWGNFSGLFSGVHGPNFTKLAVATERSSSRYELVRYLAPFQNADDSKSSGLETGIRISHQMGCCRQFRFWWQVNFNNSTTCVVLWCIIMLNFTAIGQRTAELLTISHISPSSFRGWGTFSGLFSGMRGPNFTILGQNIQRSWPSYKFVSELRYLAAFSNAGASKLGDVENDAKFCTFWPPVKSREGWASSLGKLLELYTHIFIHRNR